MITEEEFSHAIRAFLGELSMVCYRQTPSTLKQVPDFVRELQEATATLRDPTTPDAEVLSTAFGLINEFADRSWKELVSEAYSSYAAERRQVATPRSTGT